MRFFDDPGKALQQMEDELLEEEWEEEYEEDDSDEDFPILTRHGSRPVNYAVDFDRTVYDDEETDDAYYKEDYLADRKSRKKRKKGSGGLVLLLLGELAGITGIIWWWIQWLK